MTDAEMNKIFKMRIVEVEWKDPASRYGWDPPERYAAASEVAICRSVGYLLTENDERLVIVQSASLNQTVADSIVIPKNAIVRRRVLKGGLEG